jgi:hypothetical protein
VVEDGQGKDLVRWCNSTIYTPSSPRMDAFLKLHLQFYQEERRRGESPHDLTNQCERSR